MLHSTACLAIALFVSYSSASFHDFGIPASNATVDVKAFNVVNFTAVNASEWIFAPILPGRQSFTLPVHSFLIEYEPSRSRVLFDLGMRNDPSNYAPAISALFAAGVYSIPSDFKDIGQLLVEGGIPLKSINAAIWSHSHLDHIGDMSKFPNSTALVIGPGTNHQLYPEFPDGVLQASDFAGHDVQELSFEETNLTFSGLKAIDYFGDGSLYLLNTPGHLPGHLTALARVTPSSFILLAGDTFHHPGVMRPRPGLQRHFPCPAHLLETTNASISTDFFWSPDTKEHAFDMKSRSEPLLTISDLPVSVYADPATAKVSLDKIAEFDADPDFLVLIAHDQSVISSIPYFPRSLNDWKAGNWKRNLVWHFVEESSPAFVFSPA